jgi:transcriptional regulator with XRE-family HTH domain
MKSASGGKMNQSFYIQRDSCVLKVDGHAVLGAWKAAGLSQTAVARRMEEFGYHLSQAYVSRIEHNTCPHRFHEREATALAAVLGVGITEITICRLLAGKEVGRVRELTHELEDLLGKPAA